MLNKYYLITFFSRLLLLVGILFFSSVFTALPVVAAPFAYVTDVAFNNVLVIDTTTNAVVGTIAVGDGPYGVAVTPDGKHAYVTNIVSNNVSVIDTTTNAVEATVAVGGSPYGVAVTPDGKHAYVANAGTDTVSVIDTTTNAVVSTIAVGGLVYEVTVTPDGKHAYVTSGSTPGNVSVIDTTSNAVVSTIAVGGSPYGVAVTPDGKHAYVANVGSDTVSVIDTTTNAVIGTIAVGDGPWGVAVTPDGKHAYVTNLISDIVSVIDTTTNTVEATVAVGIDPRSVAVTPDGKHAYVANVNSNDISVIDTASNTVNATIPVSGAPGGVAIQQYKSPEELSKGMSALRYVSGLVVNRAGLYVAAFDPLLPLCPGLVLPCSALATGALVAGLTEGYLISNIINDPPDYSYNKIFKPLPHPPLVALDLTAGFPATLVASANKSFQDEASLYSMLEAWLVTLERYNAAVTAGDAVAIASQKRALEDYILQTSKLALLVNISYSQYISDLKDFFSELTITDQQLQETKDRLANEGFNSLELTMFRRYGLDDIAIQEILDKLISLDFSSIDKNVFRAAIDSANFFKELSNFTGKVYISTRPTNVKQCMNDGWKDFGFNNQGRCIQFITPLLPTDPKRKNNGVKK